MFRQYKQPDSRKSSRFAEIVAALVLCVGLICPGAAERPNFPERMPIVERPFSGDPDKFSFAIIGDKTGGGLDKWPVFDRAIDEINVLKPDFAIMVGDLIQGDTRDPEQLAAEWKEFWHHESALIVPFLPLPGNHDITNPVMYQYWKDNIGRTYSAFSYKNCLFILLNTEEWHDPTHAEWDWEQGWFGEAQTEYVADTLAQHPNVRHTFVFLHRPIWLYKNSGWEQIEEALSDRAYTVFAGHYHNLTLHTRDDHRYFVLSATGGGLTPQEAPEAGAFDHYSLVTVDGEAVDVAIIKPGNIYPADISTTAFKEKLASLLTFTPRFHIEETQPLAKGTLDIALENTLEKQVEVDIAFHPNAQWQISPHRLTLKVKPGQTANAAVALTVAADVLTPLPIYDYAMMYGGEQLRGGSNLFHPIQRTDMRVLKNWMLLGPFDLGVTEIPATPNEVPPNFLATPPPEPNVDKTYEGQAGEIAWQEHISEAARINLDTAFGNPEWAFGYGVTHIKSPDARQVFAQIGWGCHLGRIFLNGVEIPAAAAPSAHLFRGWAHFKLPLKAGWNTLTIQAGDYTGGWDYRMEVADGSDMLQFSADLTFPKLDKKSDVR